MAQVELAGAQVGGFQVGGRAVVPVECLVVGAQQHAAGSLALPVWPDGEDGEVMVSGASGVVPVRLALALAVVLGRDLCFSIVAPKPAGGPAAFWPVGSHRAAAVRSVVVWTTPLAIACST